MSTRTFGRHAYGITIAVLTAGILLLGGFLLLVALPEMGVLTTQRDPTPTPAPSAMPAPTSTSEMALSPIGIEMPKDANCEACHLTTSGTVGTKPIPKLAHPLWGFRDCTACHAKDSLVETAPGHSSLHTQDCLVCHQVDETLASGSSVAPMRPEHMGGDKACTACHGIDEHAPLPDAMADRENCWMCHYGKEFTYLFETTSSGASQDARPGASPAAAAPGATASAAPGGASVRTRWALVRP